MREERILNLGAGESTIGDIRFDISRHGWPDVQGTAAELPLAAATFDRVLADQVLEHLPSEKVVATLNEVYRVLKPGGTLEVYVPHADSRLSHQDPTHKSTWTYRTVDYFTDGSFAWYFEDEPFEFTLEERDVNIWVHPERPFSGIRSKEIQLRH
jgi:SAM-dependent methyltransferase